jgi:hypothetical protein
MGCNAWTPTTDEPGVRRSKYRGQEHRPTLRRSPRTRATRTREPVRSLTAQRNAKGLSLIVESFEITFAVLLHLDETKAAHTARSLLVKAFRPGDIDIVTLNLALANMTNRGLLTKRILNGNVTYTTNPTGSKIAAVIREARNK